MSTRGYFMMCCFKFYIKDYVGVFCDCGKVRYHHMGLRKMRAYLLLSKFDTSNVSHISTCSKKKKTFILSSSLTSSYCISRWLEVINDYIILWKDFTDRWVVRNQCIRQCWGKCSHFSFIKAACLHRNLVFLSWQINRNIETDFLTL